MRFLRIIHHFILWSVLLISLKAISQKYNFVNWTVEDGLIQSQVSFICQDSYRQLWIGTQGGVSKFDGKKFSGYTVQDGLASNSINTMLCDKAGRMWMGTSNGLSVYNGKNFKTIKPVNEQVNSISSIIQSADTLIYFLDNYTLYTVHQYFPKRIAVSSDSSEKITTLINTHDNDLLTYVYRKGLYVLKSNKWALLCEPTKELVNLFISEIFITSKHDTLLASNTGLYIVKLQKIELFKPLDQSLENITVLSIAEDSKENLWLGSDNGVYKLEGSQLYHFDAKSGFTDNSVNHIYKDAENNLWFSTNADGIYKFRENTFTYYDETSGLSNTIVMGVTQTTDGTIYVAGYGGGLYKINAFNDLKVISAKGMTLNETKINCLYADDENNVWIGTINKGIYSYSEKKGFRKIESKNNPDFFIRGATIFLKDLSGNLLIGSTGGLYVKNKFNNIIRVKEINNGVTALKQFDKNQVLVGTSKGLFLVDDQLHVVPFNEKEFGNSSVLCLAKSNTTIWIGTTDKGVLSWNYKNGKRINYSTADGLPSNFIYSIDVSNKQKAWIGTGFGISNLQFDKNGKVIAIKNYGRSDGLLGMECNHNCLLKAADSSLWFGTTKGLFHFNPYTDITEKNQPLVLLRSVKLFSSDITDSSLYKSSGSWFNVPEELKLASKQNHLTFELGSIYFTNPEDVLYKYQLEGIDKGFTTSSNPFIIYPAIPPGNYTLKIMGITKSGVTSSNIINYSFEIEKAFYQTRFFQLLIILLLIATGALMTYVFTRGKQKRKQRAKEVLEKIREEEFIKLRQRTAEDFHDEMGNNLTRISVLTDILKTKLSGTETDVKKIVQQIKENTTSLYNGSRDIIWSLNSQNDGMYEIAEHIKDIGNEFFHETTLDFNYMHNIMHNNLLKLKLDYSRNLTMIFKEAFNNIIKHSKASNVTVTLEFSDNNNLTINLCDNGKGFVTDSSSEGNGIKNMFNRVQRMNGEMTVDSTKHGTQINITLKNIFV